MATAGGARSTGLAAEIGLLAPGRKADIILLDRDAWGFVPLNDPVRQLAFSVGSEAVRTSIIDGRVVMRDRVLTTLDEAAVKAEVQELAERFRREWRPRMATGAGRVAPFVRAVYERATRLDLPGLPERMLPPAARPGNRRGPRAC
jgi:5-methylthioadenosine/S-adenosylhomocysteine deaminase